MASDDERRVQLQLQQELQVAYMQEFYSVSASEEGGGEERREEVATIAVHYNARRTAFVLPLFFLFFSLFFPFYGLRSIKATRRKKERTRKEEEDKGKTFDCSLTCKHSLAAVPPPLFDLSSRRPPRHSKKNFSNRPSATSASPSASPSPRRPSRRESRPACRGAATATRTRRRRC